MSNKVTTQLLGRTVQIKRDQHLPKWVRYEGFIATIESVHIVEGEPYYTLSMHDGELVQAYSHAFLLQPVETKD